METKNDVKIAFHLSHLCTMPFPASWTIWLAKRLGCQGVEILSTGMTRGRFRYYRRLAGYQLNMTAHQAWSHEESNAPDWKSMWMERLHYMPHTGVSPEVSMPNYLNIPKIVYAHWIDLAYNGTTYWLQTCPVRLAGGISITYNDFMDRWEAMGDSAPWICSDIQHTLEWMTADRQHPFLSPSNFAGYKPDRLAEMYLGSVRRLLKGLRQVHLNESRPELGPRGLNVPLGTGVLAPVMRDICQELKKMCAQKRSIIVVPEVTPPFTRPYKIPGHARAMLDKAREYFR